MEQTPQLFKYFLGTNPWTQPQDTFMLQIGTLKKFSKNTIP